MNLEFGQTPWDALSDADLLVQFRQMHLVLQEASHYLENMYRIGRTSAASEYWTHPQGSGAYAREIVQQTLERAQAIATTSCRKEILLAVFALYIAIEETSSVAQMSRLARTSAFWVQDLNHFLYYDDDEMREHLFKGFSRYAVDLLFEDRTFPVRKDWVVCPVCGEVFAKGLRTDDSPIRPGAIHKDVLPIDLTCKGVLRAYSWTDLNRPDLEKTT